MERDEKGRFVKRRPSPELQEAIKAMGSAEKVEQVLEKLHSLAMAGEVRAGDLYLAYTVGKPGPSTETQNSQTWKQFVEQVLNGDDSQTSPD